MIIVDSSGWWCQGTDGFSFSCRTRPVDCPILLVTAKTDEADLGDRSWNRRRHYITKPLAWESWEKGCRPPGLRENRERKHVITLGAVFFLLNSRQVRLFQGAEIPLQKASMPSVNILPELGTGLFQGKDLRACIWHDGEGDSSHYWAYKNIRAKLQKRYGVSVETVGIGYKWK